MPIDKGENARRKTFSFKKPLTRLGLGPYKLMSEKIVVAVVQLVERQIVILVVVGSSPIGHPILRSLNVSFASRV